MYEGGNYRLDSVSCVVSPKEEKASNWDVPFEAEGHDRSRNCRLPSSRGAVQPQDPLSTRNGQEDPGHDFVEDGQPRFWVAFRSINFLCGIESRSFYVGLEVDEAVCINKVITGILLGNFLLCYTFFVVASMNVRRRGRRLIMLDECSVVNSDM